MGAWGSGVYEDDSSCDLLWEAMESNVKSFVSGATAYKDAAYLEYEDCHRVIVAGSILDSLLNATDYQHGTDGYDEWLSRQERTGLSALKADIIVGLKIVISDKSELNELWQENEEEYLSWQKNILDIISNLGK